MEINNEEKMVSKYSGSIKISFLLGVSFKINILPFGPVPGLFSFNYILKKDIWA